MTRNVYSVQRDLALNSGLRSEIIWDSLSADQSNILHEKIKTIIPDNGKNLNRINRLRKQLFENIWMQRKYSNKTLLSAIIYVLVTDEANIENAKYSTNFTYHPVFRTRKCITDSNSSAGCCMKFIDETGRIYENWSMYLKKNVLPKGTMIVPLNGVYTFDSNDDEVQLEYYPTPASSKEFKILNTTDKVATFGSLMATVPIAAALAFPIAGPVIAAASTVAATTAAYSTIRSAIQLTDRRKHGQSTSLKDPVARGNWIGVAGGVVGLGASGATKALTYASSAGQDITLATKLAVNGINLSSVILSGTGVVNGVYDLVMKLNDDEKLCAFDLLQLASSLLVFTHSLNNLKIASKIIACDKGLSIRSELNTQIRRVLKKIASRTSSSNGNSGRMDLIRCFNDIPVMDVLTNLHKVNAKLKQLPTINTFIPNIINGIVNSQRVNLEYLAEEFGMKFVQHISNESSLIDMLNAMVLYFCERTFRFLLNLAKVFIDDYGTNRMDTILNPYISTESVLFKILMNCVTKYSSFTYEFLEKKTADILKDVEDYFNSLNPLAVNSPKRKCPHCIGYYYICDL